MSANPECAFKVKDEDSFQDHADRNHSQSSLLFGHNEESELITVKIEPSSEISSEDFNCEVSSNVDEIKINEQTIDPLGGISLKKEEAFEELMFSESDEKPIQIVNSTLQEVSEFSSTTAANFEILKSENIKLKIENMKLKMEVAKLQRGKNIEMNKATKELKQHKKREGELVQSLDKVTKSLDNVRKANNVNRAKVSTLNKKVKRLESPPYIDGLKKQGAKEILEKAKLKANLEEGEVLKIKNLRPFLVNCD